MKRELLDKRESGDFRPVEIGCFSFANMSHEIRKFPLNAIVGFSRIIAESTDARSGKTTTTSWKPNIEEAFLQLINDVSWTSPRLKRVMVEFTHQSVMPAPRLKEIHDALKFRCPEGVELVYEASDEEIVVEGDKNRIFQVISNLIGNAFKFTTAAAATDTAAKETE